MPDVVGGPRLSKLVKKININNSKDFLVLNLEGGQNKFEGVLNIVIGNYHNAVLICSLYTLLFKDSSVGLIYALKKVFNKYKYN